MKNLTDRLLGLVGLAAVTAAGAGGFELKRGAIATGGGVMTGTTFSVTGAVGQPALDELAGTEFAVRGGVLAEPTVGDPLPDLVFRNGFE